MSRTNRISAALQRVTRVAQASRVTPIILGYRPGYAYLKHSRGTTAWSRNAAGLWVQNGVAEVRDQHYVGDERTTLLEKQSTNLFQYTGALKNAVWQAANTTVTLNATQAPDGTQTGTRISQSVTNASFRQVLSLDPAGKTYTFSIWLRADQAQTSSIKIENADTSEAITATCNVDTTWRRFSVTLSFVATSTQLKGIMWPSQWDQPMQTVYAWGPQMEEGPSATSYIPTEASPVTRSADFLSFAFPSRPRAMTIYTRFLERGTFRESSYNRILMIGSASVADFGMQVDSPVDRYHIRYFNGADAVYPSLPSVAVPALEDWVELRAVLRSNGDTFIGQSLNGRTEALGAVVNRALPASWGLGELALGSRESNTGHGLNAFSHVFVFTGERSMQECRRLASVSLPPVLSFTGDLSGWVGARSTPAWMLEDI